MEAQSAIVVSIVRNQNRKDVRLVKLQRPAHHDGHKYAGLFAPLVQAAANKFKLKRKDVRLFDSRSGLELLGVDREKCEAAIVNGATIFVSAGEENVTAGSEPAASNSSATASKDSPKEAQVEAQVIVLAKGSPVEAAAVQQLHWVARLPGVTVAVGLPDLHPGPACPIGTAVASRGVLYPDLVGTDIGCGIMLLRTTLSASAADKPRTLENWASSVNIEGGWESDAGSYLRAEGVAPSAFDKDSLGTVGRGNHFAELQAIERIEDEVAAAQLGLSRRKLLLCVHSGSRGLGESVLKQHVQEHGPNTGLAEESKAAQEYLERHAHACSWARVNRQLIAHRLLAQLGEAAGGHCDGILDVCHNNVTRLERKTDGSDQVHTWLHRKGAAPCDCGPVVIPGSRGSLSYLVMPTAGSASSGWSLAHGAGRQLARTQALAAGRARYPRARDLCVTKLGSRVVCEDKELLYEEVPDAYKDIGCVLADLMDRGLCKVIAVLRPVLTYKAKAPPWAASKTWL